MRRKGENVAVLSVAAGASRNKGALVLTVLSRTRHFCFISSEVPLAMYHCSMVLPTTSIRASTKGVSDAS
jgi:hypothetical protein